MNDRVTHYPCIVKPCPNFVGMPDTPCATHQGAQPTSGGIIGVASSSLPVGAKAIKKDAEKPPLQLVPRELIYGAARAYGFGAKKYSAFNYRNGDGIAVSRLARASVGHVLDWLHGEELDPESALCHLDHAAAALGMLMDTIARIRAGNLPATTDDRWKEIKR